MRHERQNRVPPSPVAAAVRQSVASGGERLWQVEDFGGLPFTAVAKALSRLTQAGELDRVSKGVYYRSRRTRFGASRPNPGAMRSLARRKATFFPSGLSAANLLGFSTQAPGQPEFATTAQSLPRKLVGERTLVRTRRPKSWEKLPETDAALLDFLRTRGRTSELPPEETVRKTVALLREKNRFRSLLGVADSEPPRVRALLGALGEYMRRPARELAALRTTLNPLSRFDFGLFGVLSTARAWQAKAGVR